MADTHLHFNDQNQYGRMLRRLLNLCDEFLDSLNDVTEVMSEMRDGDGSQSAHYVEVTSRFGFVSDAEAKTAYDGLKLVHDKLTTDAAVTNVGMALRLMRARLRG